MVECECAETILVSVAHAVLIDTWWNVNSNPATVEVEIVAVLIDTWWNVN